MKKIIGIDLGGTTVKMGLFLENGELLHSWFIETDTTDDGKNIISDIATSIEQVLKEQNVDFNDILGAGIGAPGPVTNDGVIHGAVNLGWSEMNLAGALQKLINVPVYATNDANSAALGELWQGSAKGYLNMIFVTLGTGVGGGVIIDGNIVNGAHGGGGEVGHMPLILEDGEQCNCGRRGCLETVTSATGIVRETKKALIIYNEKTLLSNNDKLTARDIFDAAKAGDQFAITMVDKYSYYLGIGLAQMAAVTNPDVIIIGGGVSKAGTFLLDNVKKHFLGSVFPPIKDVQFKIAELENDAGIYGAAYLVVNNA